MHSCEEVSSQIRRLGFICSYTIGNIRTVSELLLSPPNELSKRLKTNLSDAQSITDAVCKELYPVTIQLDHPANFADHKFTTGDALLDEAIGGGIRTGMVWELVGER